MEKSAAGAIGRSAIAAMGIIAAVVAAAPAHADHHAQTRHHHRHAGYAGPPFIVPGFGPAYRFGRDWRGDYYVAPNGVIYRPTGATVTY